MSFARPYGPRQQNIFIPQGSRFTYTNIADALTLSPYERILRARDMREQIIEKTKTVCSGVEFVDVTTMSDEQPVYEPVSRPWVKVSEVHELEKPCSAYIDGVHEKHKEAYSTVEELDYKAACEELGLSATETALKLALEEQTKYDSGKDRRNAGKKNHNIFYYLYRIFTFHRSPRET